jgi:hypothetical protein
MMQEQPEEEWERMDSWGYGGECEFDLLAYEQMHLEVELLGMPVT